MSAHRRGAHRAQNHLKPDKVTPKDFPWTRAIAATEGSP